MTYRIRWARIDVGGQHVHMEKRCIAERPVKFLGLFPTWWPLPNGTWRDSEEEALRDIENDRRLYQPLPKTKVIP